MICSIPSDPPASAANTTISPRPITRVHFAPIRLETHPTPSIATEVTSR
jgi:hypothetical protein